MSDRMAWMKFYPTDWTADEKLGLTSLNAQGLWIQMLCIMHRSQRTGTMPMIKGKPPSIEQLAIMVGASVGEVAQGLKELDAAGVFSRDRDGSIYSRRMKKDFQARKKSQKYGLLGGNPLLVANGRNFNGNNGLRDKAPLNPGVNPRDKGRARAQESESESESGTRARRSVRPDPAVGGGDQNDHEAVAVGAVVRDVAPGAALLATAEAVMRAAGFAPRTHLGQVKAVDQVRGWLDAGITQDEMLAIVTSMVAASPDTTSSLKRFDKAIRGSHRKGNGTTPRAAGYVSESGHHYRGSLESVSREAEARSDWNTYWQVQADMKKGARS